MEEPVEEVNKLDAAVRQLREAILLFFERRDTIAIHTLAAASHQILADIASRCQIGGILKNNPLIRPEKKKDWNDLVNKSQNFFKHADRDSNAVLEFHPSITPFFLLDAVSIFQQLTDDTSQEQRVFLSWFVAKYPDFLVDGPMKDSINNLLASGLNPDDFSILLALARGNMSGI